MIYGKKRIAVRHLTIFAVKSCAKWQNFGSGLSGLGIALIALIVSMGSDGIALHQ